MNWHTRNITDIYTLTDSKPEGLSDEEAARRLRESGPNQLEDTRRKKPLTLLLRQFSDLMIMILLAAAVVSGFIGDFTDTMVILGIVIVNAIIGFLQEYRADKALEALKKISVSMTQVRRDRGMEWRNAVTLVPGDVVILEAGNAVPADIRLTETHNLKIEEAALTGESQPTDKSATILDQEELALHDRHNMAFKGTFVTWGRGTGVVVATGMRTEIGKVAAMLQQKEPPTPLQLRLATFGKKLSAIILFLCAIFFVTGWIRGEDPVKMVLTSISLAVAAIPEALPAVVTISLALAARRLVKSHSLVRNLYAVETLGSVTYICTDKTGTLTKNRMVVDEIYAGGTTFHVDDEVPQKTQDNPGFRMMLRFFVLNNDAAVDADGAFIGDPTEVALLEAAMQPGIDAAVLTRLAEIPFDGTRKMMTTFHPWEGRIIAITKGAPDILVSRSIGDDHDAVLQALDRMAGRGQRVLGFAYRLWDGIPDLRDPARVESNLLFVGMAGLMDPPREEIRNAVEECVTAGIVPVIVTGDHPLTARNIAERTGILREKEDQVITGKDLASLSDAEYKDRIEKIRVYARVSPEQKMRIITTLQEKGHFAAMAGDGINDAPSLKRANIGVAMGIAGTDVSREAADMILLDDNFRTIVTAIREGRRIYDNILKFIKYLITTNSAEIWTLLMAPLIGLPIPLLPIHILWVNLVSDGLPAVSLSFEKAEEDIMRRPPRSPQQSVFAEGRALHILWVGILMAGVVLAVQSWSLTNGYHWQTMTFTVLSIAQLTHLLVVRSDTQSLFRLGLLSNKPLLASFIFSFGLQLAVVYITPLNAVFKTEPLTVTEMGICLLASSVIFVSVEIEKWIKRIKRRS